MAIDKEAVLQITHDLTVALINRPLVAPCNHQSFGGKNVADSRAAHQERTSIRSQALPGSRSSWMKGSHESAPKEVDEGQITHLIRARLKYDLYMTF